MYRLRPLPCREGFPRLFSTSLRACHENPLGLPRKGQQGPPQIPRKGAPLTKRPIPNVKKVIAVASGKGGVGKSTIAGTLLLHLHLFFPMTILHAFQSTSHSACLTSKTLRVVSEWASLTSTFSGRRSLRSWASRMVVNPS